MINPLYTITVKDIQLQVIYDKREMGLYRFFSADSRMYDYVQNSIDKAFYDAVYKVSPTEYCLNIASVEDFSTLDLKNERAFLEGQLTIFMPIIQRFMVYALTGLLDNETSS